MSGAKLWRFDSEIGPLVARAWPDGTERWAIEFLHRTLEKARHLGFVPIPIPALDGSTVQEEADILWEVAPWMPGTADLRNPPPVAKVVSAFSALAAFHLAMGPSILKPVSPGLLERAEEIRKLLKVHLASWRRTVLDRANDPRRELALRWLELAGRVAPVIAPEIQQTSRLVVNLQYVIRDARPDHFLFTGDRLTGLVDFGAMGLDPVSADLARLLAEWIGTYPGLRGEALAAYARVRPLDSVETLLIDAYERSAALLGGGHWLRWHFIEGIAFDDPTAVLRGLRRGVERIERLCASHGIDVP